jgi:hypothetical protein
MRNCGAKVIHDHRGRGSPRVTGMQEFRLPAGADASSLRGVNSSSPYRRQRRGESTSGIPAYAAHGEINWHRTRGATVFGAPAPNRPPSTWEAMALKKHLPPSGFDWRRLAAAKPLPLWRRRRGGRCRRTIDPAASRALFPARRSPPSSVKRLQQNATQSQSAITARGRLPGSRGPGAGMKRSAAGSPPPIDPGEEALAGALEWAQSCDPAPRHRHKF